MKDGLTNLSDKDIIRKANETPKKLKDSLKQLLNKTEKFNLTLDDSGEVKLTY